MRRGYGLVYTGQAGGRDRGLRAGGRACRRSTRLRSTCIWAWGWPISRPDARTRPSILARQALAERPGLTWPYRDLAAYYAAAGKREQAREALEKFVYLRPAMSAASIRDGLRFMNGPLLDRYVGGLEEAGLK